MGTGRLADEAIARTRVALARYASTMRELGVERVDMVATSATRATPATATSSSQ